MELPEQDLLALLVPWMREQRWFAGRGGAITSARLVSPPGWWALVDVEIDEVEVQTYQVPLRISATRGPGLIGHLAGYGVHDGLEYPQVMRDLLRPAKWLETPPDLTEYRRLQVQQSNSSGVFGDLLVKVFRRLVPGVNPDVEVHQGLARVGCTDVAPLRGWVDLEWGEGSRGQVVMLQRFLRDATDGYVLATEAMAGGSGFTDAARDLGRTTARVHGALAAAFGTSRCDAEQVRERVDRMHGRLVQAVAAVPDITPLASVLHDKVERLAGAACSPVQRIHGDLHLGQSLCTPDGWRLIDFEGEPGSDPQERRAPGEPVQDVAGMLRSFDYAADGARAWRDACGQAFLEGYDMHIDPVVLEAYLVDKAAYEAVYEQRHRPSWLRIPLAALRELANAG